MAATLIAVVGGLRLIASAIAFFKKALMLRTERVPRPPVRYCLQRQDTLRMPIGIHVHLFLGFTGLGLCGRLTC